MNLLHAQFRGTREDMDKLAAEFSKRKRYAVLEAREVYGDWFLDILGTKNGKSMAELEAELGLKPYWIGTYQQATAKRRGGE